MAARKTVRTNMNSAIGIFISNRKKNYINMEDLERFADIQFKLSRIGFVLGPHGELLQVMGFGIRIAG